MSEQFFYPAFKLTPKRGAVTVTVSKAQEVVLEVPHKLIRVATKYRPSRSPRGWRQRYQGTLRRLRDAGVRLPAGLEVGSREYRHGWELELAGFALYWVTTGTKSPEMVT
jgi:hypothetical protein